MKLTAVLLFSFCLSASAGSYGQNITISFRDASLAKVFKEVQRQSGYKFLYASQQLANAKTVSITVNDMPLKEVLDLCFKDQPLSFVIVNKTVIVKLKEEKKMTVVAAFGNEQLLPVTGRVVDASGDPLVGASISIKGGNASAFANGEGRFSMNANLGDIITVSYVGYLGISVKIVQPNSNGTINAVVVHVDRQATDATEDLVTKSNQTSSVIIISSDQQPNSNTKDIQLLFSLTKKIASLNEVKVSTGYWTTTKQLSTGNVTKVTAKEIQRQPVTSPLMALQGRVAGLDILPNSGAPGSAAKIRIRGENSLSTRFVPGAGSPLYVVDGVIMESRSLESVLGVFYGLGNDGTGGIDPLININPENIESIEVLKDADVLAIYGSRGANGVILITTKKSKSQRGTIDASYYRGIGQVAQKLDLLNTQQYLEMRREALANNSTTASAGDYDVNGTWDENRYTDWQKVLFGGKASISDVQFNYSSGTAQTTFRIGGGYHKEGTVFPGDFGQTRVTGNFNLNHFSKDQKFNLNFSTNYGISRNKMFSTNAIGTAFRLAPNAPKLYNDDGSLNWELRNIGGTLTNTFSNPLADLLNVYAATTNTLNLSGTASYKITSHYSIKANLGYIDLKGDELLKNPIAARSPTLANFIPGYSSFGINGRSSWIIEPQLNYSNDFGRHSFNVVLGASVQENTSQRKTETADGYTSDALLNSMQAATTVYVTEDQKIMYRYTGFFGRIGYNYQEKYLVNISGRRDGSSRFGPGNQFGNFGAIGAAWIFSKENFIERKMPFISFGKLRGSYGTTGSDQIGDYKFYNLYGIGGTKYYGQVVLEPSALFNKNFQWELTRKLEAALELGLFDNRLSVELAWYRNRSSNQLIKYQLSAVTGFDDVLRNLDATVQNAGWELLINSRNIVTKKISWSTSFNLTLPKNKLVKFPGIEESTYKTLYKVGESLSIQRLYLWDGVDPVTGNHKIKDVKADGIINDDDRVFMLPTDRHFYGGLTNSLRVGSLELSVLLQFSRQYLREGTPDLPGRVNYNQPVEVLKRWQKTGDITNIAKYTTNLATSEEYTLKVNQSDYLYKTTWFVRVKTVSLSYSLPQKWLKKSGVQTVNAFLQVQNLGTFTNYSGLDPDGGLVGGLPQLRMITGGIQIKL